METKRPQCAQAGCQDDAVFLVDWPGQPTMQCAKDAARLQALAAILGYGIACTPLAPVEEKASSE